MNPLFAGRIPSFKLPVSGAKLIVSKEVWGAIQQLRFEGQSAELFVGKRVPSPLGIGVGPACETVVHSVRDVIHCLKD